MHGVDTKTINEEMNIVDMLGSTGILSSKREAREFINAGSITINGERIQNLEYTINKKDAIDGEVLVIRRGKKKYFIGKIS